ncbi:uncharacterized protein LOC131947366 [Physella acuta]|uniref:uncharacterized protein LOC131947366 n=1 Tax=Physella acuta TaxID=109671 RepID=UPI0027DADE99|nr:uncharacterized protein LOC131947366 [Physella acuta]
MASYQATQRSQLEIKREGEALGYAGTKLLKWVRDEVDAERARVDREREFKQAEWARDKEKEERQIQLLELEIKRIELANRSNEYVGKEEEQIGVGSSKVTLPKFDGVADHLDFFLLRFEEEARQNRWRQDCWSNELRKLMPAELLPVCFMGHRAEAKASYEERWTVDETIHRRTGRRVGSIGCT